jgi:hypothetical protein
LTLAPDPPSLKLRRAVIKPDEASWRGRERTAKSCGSGAAVLALSLREVAQATEAKEPFSGKSTK